MAKQPHIVLKVCGDGDVDLALVPVTTSLVEAVIRRVGGLYALNDDKLVQAEFWNGAAVFFERPDDPHLGELLDEVEDKDYLVVPERPDVHWRLFKRTDCIRMAIRRDRDEWEVYWKAYRGSIEFSTASLPVTALAALTNPYLKPESRPYAALADGTPLHPAHDCLQPGERCRRGLSWWNGSVGEWVGVTLDGRLFRQSQLWGGEGPRPERWEKFRLGGA